MQQQQQQQQQQQRRRRRRQQQQQPQRNAEQYINFEHIKESTLLYWSGGALDVVVNRACFPLQMSSRWRFALGWSSTHLSHRSWRRRLRGTSTPKHFSNLSRSSRNLWPQKVITPFAHNTIVIYGYDYYNLISYNNIEFLHLGWLDNSSNCRIICWGRCRLYNL